MTVSALHRDDATAPSTRASLYLLGKFGLVGALNTGLDFVLFSVLRLGAVPILVANVMSTSVCMMLSFLMNRRFVFRATGGWRRQATLFLLGTAFSMYVLQNAVIWFLVHVFPAPLDAVVAVGHGVGLSSPRWEILLRSDTAKLVATGASLTWNFCFYRWAVFGGRDEASPLNADASRP
jgi:putative flippase GtrA